MSKTARFAAYAEELKSGRKVGGRAADGVARNVFENELRSLRVTPIRVRRSALLAGRDIRDRPGMDESSPRGVVMLELPLADEPFARWYR